MIEVIDPGTSQVTNQIPGGWLNFTIYDTFYNLAVSGDGRRLAFAGRINVTFVDTVRQRVIGAIPVLGSFITVALSPHGDFAYLAFSPTGGGAEQV